MIEAPERVFLAKATSGRLCDFGERYGEEYVRVKALPEIFARYSKAEADHIEMLERKLANAVEALTKIRDVADISEGVEWCAMIADRALAETGETK